MTGEEIRVVWQSANAEVERDALVFWRKRGLLAAGVDAAGRLKQLCLVTYDNGKIVGAVTAQIREIDFLHAKLAVIRVAAPPDRASGRLRFFPARMVLAAQRALEEWSLAHPEERVMGVGGIVARGTYRKMHQAIWKPFGFVLVNYTQRGEQFRLAWFRHATVE